MLEFTTHRPDQQRPHRVIHVNTRDADDVLAKIQDDHGSTFGYISMPVPTTPTVLTPENIPMTCPPDVVVTRKMYRCRVTRCQCRIEAYQFTFPPAPLTNRPTHLIHEQWSHDVTEFRLVDETVDGDHGQSLTPCHYETIDHWASFDASLELVTRIVLHVHPELQTLDAKVYHRISYLRRKLRGFGLTDYAATYNQLQNMCPRDDGMVYVCGKDPQCRDTCPGIEWHTLHDEPLCCECQHEPFTAIDVEEDEDDPGPSSSASTVPLDAPSQRTTASHRAKWPIVLVYCTVDQRQRCIALTNMKRAMVCDTTFGVTSSGHRLTAIVCVNEFNKVELMASFVTDNLESGTFQKCFDAWRRWMMSAPHGENWRPHCFVVDCHDAQLVALRNVFGEDVRLQLCSVHVQRAINNRLQKLDFDRGSGEKDVKRFRSALHALLYTDVRLDEPGIEAGDLDAFASLAVRTLYKDLVVGARALSAEFETYIRGEWGVAVMHLNASYVRTSVHTTNAIESYFNSVKTKYVSRRRKRSRNCYDLLDRLKSMAEDARTKTHTFTSNGFARRIAETMIVDGAADEYDARSRAHSTSLVGKVWDDFDATSLYLDERASRDRRTQVRKYTLELHRCSQHVRESQVAYDTAIDEMRKMRADLSAKKDVFMHTRKSQASHSTEVLALERLLKQSEAVVNRALNDLEIARANEDAARQTLDENGDVDPFPDDQERPGYLGRIRDSIRLRDTTEHTVDMERWECTCTSADKVCPGLNMCVHRVVKTGNDAEIVQMASSWAVGEMREEEVDVRQQPQM